MTYAARHGEVLNLPRDGLDRWPEIGIENAAGNFEPGRALRFWRQLRERLDEDILTLAWLDTGEQEKTQRRYSVIRERLSADIWNRVVQTFHRALGIGTVDGCDALGRRQEQIRERHGRAQLRFLAKIMFADRSRFVQPPHYWHLFGF